MTTWVARVLALVGLVAVVVIALVPLAARAASSPHVEVFTDSDRPVSHHNALPGAVVFLLDGMAKASDELSEGLPTDPQKALPIAQQRLAERQDLHEKMMSAGQGLAQAYLGYQLDRYPAVVIDGRYVIYGVTDLAQVRRIYEEATR